MYLFPHELFLKKKVLCNIIPMKVGHIILGRPWKYDHKIKHDGYTNNICFNL